MTGMGCADLAIALAPNLDVSGVIAMLVPELETLGRVLAANRIMLGEIALLGQRVQAFSGYLAPFGGALQPVSAPAAQWEASISGPQGQPQVGVAYQRAARSAVVAQLVPIARQAHSSRPSSAGGSRPGSEPVPEPRAHSVSAKVYENHVPWADASRAHVQRSALASRSLSLGARGSANSMSMNVGSVAPSGLETDRSSHGEVSTLEPSTIQPVAPNTVSPQFPGGSIPIAPPDGVLWSRSATPGGALATGTPMAAEGPSSSGQMSRAYTEALWHELVKRSGSAVPAAATSVGPNGFIAETTNRADPPKHATVAPAKSSARLLKRTIEALGASRLAAPFPVQDSTNSETGMSATATLPTHRTLAAQSTGTSMPTSQDDPSQGESASLQGVVLLDGTRIGRWMITHLEHHASRPRAMTTGIDPRMSATYPGAPTGV